MITIAREFTKEQLQQIIETDHVQCGEASALARIALASLEAEAVAYIGKTMLEDIVSGGRCCGRVWAGNEDGFIGESRIPLYAATQLPQPAVPGAISTRQAILKMEECEPCDSINVAYKYGWNARRDAMLKGAEPSTDNTNQQF